MKIDAAYIRVSTDDQIAIKLNSMGIVSKRGNAFESRTIEYILSNPAYIGKLRRNPNGTDVQT